MTNTHPKENTSCTLVNVDLHLLFIRRSYTALHMPKENNMCVCNLNCTDTDVQLLKEKNNNFKIGLHTKWLFILCRQKQSCLHKPKGLFGIIYIHLKKKLWNDVIFFLTPHYGFFFYSNPYQVSLKYYKSISLTKGFTFRKGVETLFGG